MGKEEATEIVIAGGTRDPDPDQRKEFGVRNTDPSVRNTDLSGRNIRRDIETVHLETLKEVEDRLRLETEVIDTSIVKLKNDVRVIVSMQAGNIIY